MCEQGRNGGRVGLATLQTKQAERANFVLLLRSPPCVPCRVNSRSRLSFSRCGSVLLLADGEAPQDLRLPGNAHVLLKCLGV